MKFHYRISSLPPDELVPSDVFLVEGEISVTFRGNIFFRGTDFLLVELANFLHEWRSWHLKIGTERVEYSSAYIEASPVLAFTRAGSNFIVESALNPAAASVPLEDLEAGVVDFLHRLTTELDKLWSIDLTRLLDDALQEKIRFQEMRTKGRKKPTY